MKALRAALAARYPRVALSHDWLTIPGGSEKSVMAILDLLPHAEVFTSIYDPDAAWPPTLRDATIHTTFLNRVPGAQRRYPRLLPLMDTAFRRFDLSGFDLVISNNHANAKNVRVPDGARHLCYCMTPMRYAWDPSFMAGERLSRAEVVAFRGMAPMLRQADRRGARGVHDFLAISHVVAERIRDCYGRPAPIIHPPVDVARFLDQPRTVADDAPYLVLGRVVPYKRFDTAVRACRALGRRLVVAGVGRDLDRVHAAAGGDELIEFRGFVSDAEVAELFASSRALLFPGLEDFGLVPVEAQAAGLPVVGYGLGGLCDSVRDGVTGVLYDDPSPIGLAAAMQRFEGLELDEAALRENAAGFSTEVFSRTFGNHVLGLDAACPTSS